MAKFYPLANPASHKSVRGILTGEKRPPKKGEWYLSGAIPECYRAPNDLSTPFHIIQLVRVKTHTVTEIIEEL